MEGKERIRRIITFTIILIALTACASPQPDAGLPNPASVFCEQNGNKHEIRSAPDGAQSGICVFSDGSSCDEWAYFRGECCPAAEQCPAPAMSVPDYNGSQILVDRIVVEEQPSNAPRGIGHPAG